MADEPPSDLVAAIKAYSADPRIQEALLFGSYAESGWNRNSTGTGGGGFFGFTGSQWPAGIYYAPAATQVATIGPDYIDAVAGTGVAGARELKATGAYGVPSNLTGAARTEFITIAAEGDYGDITDLTYIAQHGTPSPTYNDFYNNTDYLPPNLVQDVYGKITKQLGTTPDATLTSSVTTSHEQTGPPSKSGTSGQRETNADAVAVAKSNLASLSPQKTNNPDPNNPRGFIYIMNQYMNPQFEGSGTDQQGNKRTFWTGIEDAITGKAELQILGDVVGGTPGTIIHDAEIVANPTNIGLMVRQWITRLAVFAIGAVIVFIAVNQLTGGSLLNLVKSIPIPVPV